MDLSFKRRNSLGLLMMPLAIVVLSMMFMFQGTTPVEANHVPYSTGDVFAGIGNGLIKHFDGSGNLLETLNTGTGSSEDTGMAFDSAGNLYSTNFTDNSLSRFNNRGGLLDSRLLSNLNRHGESIVFDAVGNYYVGHADGSRDILKYDAEANLVATYNVATERRGSDWIDLASDQCTMFYTSEGFLIKRFDVCNNAQLADFANVGSSPSYALRIRSNGEVIVASTSRVVRLNAAGTIIDTYPRPPGETSFFFALNLDPDGTSFWTAGYSSGNVYKFDIETGGILLQFNAGIQVTLAGLTIFEEQTAALEDGDGDGLPDTWEENGFDFDGDGSPDVDLPGMGAKKDHKDVFVYVDWIEESGLLGHSHRPNQEAIDRVVEAFANAPIDDNDDGEPGIALHVVFGNGIEETDENRELGSVVGPEPSCDYVWADFAVIKENNFAPEMWPIFHYALFAHDLPNFPCVEGRPSGISRNSTESNAMFLQGSSDFIVALGAWELFFGIEVSEGTTNTRAGTFMHELGHNLGLGHGGLVLDAEGKKVVRPDHINFKPNHLSVMNYSFSSRGLRKKGFLGFFRNGNFDYSRFGEDDLPNLVEASLREQDGLGASDEAMDYGTRYYCQGTDETRTVDGLQQAVNWNCNEDEDGNELIDDDPVTTNINKDTDSSDNPVFSVLTTVNEWLHLRYKGGAIGVFGPVVELPEVTSMAVSPEITFEQDQEIGPFVENQPPMANANGPYLANEGDTITLDAFGSTDPDGEIILYEWDLDNDGEYDDATGVNPEAMFDAVGTFIIGLRVTDDSRATDTDTAQVIVSEPQGEINISDNFELLELETPRTGATPPGGIYPITSTYKYTGTAPIDDLVFEVTVAEYLDGGIPGPELDNRDANTPAGVGARLTVPLPGGILNPGDIIEVTYEVRLPRIAPFRAAADAFTTQ